MTASRWLAASLAGCASTGVASLLGRVAVADRWRRTNYRGAEVTLLGGPTYAVGALAGIALAPGLTLRVRTAAALAGGVCSAVGIWDDMAGTPAARGLGGHLRAAARGELTSGQVKLLGIGTAGVAAGCLLHRGRADALTAGVVIAGAANLLNLLDLRPGRALKVGALLSVGLVGRGTPAAITASATFGAALACLPDDLRERTMLGDCGANTLGALVGVAAVTEASRPRLLGTAAAVILLTLASERVSFTSVIARTAPLRLLDELGRNGVSPRMPRS